MATAFDDLPATVAAPAPQQNAFADLPPEQAEKPRNAFHDLPPDDHLDPRSPNYDGPTISSAPTPGLLSRAYTAVREGLSPIIGPTENQREQQRVDSAFLKRTLGLNELPEADASKTKGLIPAAFENNTPWKIPDNTSANDSGRLQLISNLIVPGAGGAFASRFPNLTAAAINSGARTANTLTSPGSLLTFGLGGELGAVAKAGGEAADLAHGVKASVEGLFTADQVRQLAGQAPETIKAAGDLISGKGDTQKNIEALIDAGASGFLATLGGKAVLGDVAEAARPREAAPAPEAPKPGSLGTAPVSYVGNTNYIDPSTSQPARSELFRATTDIPELDIKKGGTIGRDRLEAAGYSVPDTPPVPDGMKVDISADDLAKNQSDFQGLTSDDLANEQRDSRTSQGLLESARAPQRDAILSGTPDTRRAISLSDEATRETALRQSPLGGLALAADLREGRTAVPEDIRARDFQAARDELNRQATASSLKDALTSNQIGQGENITLAPGTTEGPPQNNILANVRLTDDLPEQEQFRRYLQSRAGTPPTARSPLADLKLQPLPDDAQFTVQRYDTPNGPKQFTQIDIPNPLSKGISDRVLASGDPAAIQRAGYKVPDISKIPEGQNTVGALRGLKLLPDAESETTKTNATQKGTSAESDLSQHPGVNQERLPAEAGRSNSSEQGGQIPQGEKEIANAPDEFSRASTVTDTQGPDAGRYNARIRNLDSRIEDVNTDIGTLQQRNNYTPVERWSPEDAQEYHRLTGVKDAIQKARDGVAKEFQNAKDDIRRVQPRTGDAAADEGLSEAAEEKPVPELDKPDSKVQVESENPKSPDYKKPGFVADFLAPVSTEIRRINPEIYGRLQRYETRIRTESQPYLKRLGGFFKATDGLLTTHEKSAMGNALINGRFDEVENGIKAHAALDPTGTKAALDSFHDARAVFKELHEKAVRSGVDVNELSQFWPREVIRERFAEFLKYLGADEKGAIRDVIKEREKELGRPLNDEEKVSIANAAIKNEARAGITAKPGIFKERKIQNVTKDLEPFYEDYKKSAVDYVNRVVSNVEKRSLFGKHPETVANSIGAIVSRLRDENKITGPMEDTLQKYISDRFGVGEQSGDKNLQRVKDLNFTAILANPVSATTQFINFAQSAMMNGTFNSISAIFKKREITMADFGTNNIAHELQSRSGVANFVNKAFEVSGFQKVDTLGKNNILNAALFDMRKAVADTTSARFKRFQERYEPIYGSQFPEFVKDLQQGKVSENVKMAVFSRVCDVHPVTLSEMPLKYLQNPNGRIFYQMRTFQIKQLDLFRREVFQEIKAGNTARGVGNMVRFGLFLTMAGATTDLVKDLMLGREINPPDYVLSNLLKLGGISRYQLYNAYREGLGRAATDMISPSLGNAFGVADDVLHLDKIADDPLQAKTLRATPFIGPFLYNWFGPGAEEGKTKILGGKGLGAGLPKSAKPHQLHSLGKN